VFFMCPMLSCRPPLWCKAWISTEAISTPEGARTCELLKIETNQNVF
jgi:hypothetical protein